MSTDENARPRLDAIEARYSDESVQAGQVWRAYSDVPALTAALREVLALHYAADNDPRRTPVCGACHGRAGAHACGCRSSDAQQPVCGTCVGAPDYPCPTVRAVTAHIDVTSPTLHDLTDTRGPRA